MGNCCGRTFAGEDTPMDSSKEVFSKVDLTKAQVGDTVKFRCGGTAEITEIRPGKKNILVKFGWQIIMYDIVGGRVEETEESILDVVQVIPKPFDWTTAKPGMAFKNNDITYHYIGPWLSDTRKMVFFELPGFMQTFLPEELTRFPEKDMQL